MNFFDVYLPLAGVHSNLLVLVWVGFCVEVMGVVFGLSIGFITNAALNISRFHMTFPIGTGISNIFGKFLSAMRKLHKMGREDWKLASIAVVVSLLSFEFASRVVITLETARDVGEVVRWVYVAILGGFGGFMFYDCFALQKRQTAREAIGAVKENFEKA